MIASSAFIEKPSGDNGYINGGFFVLSPKVLDHIEGNETVWEQEPMQALARAGQLAAFRHNGFWHPMDTLPAVGIRAGGMEAMGNPDPSFWGDRMVLITGHTGFKGSWLLARWPYRSARPCCRTQRSRRCAAGSWHPHGRPGPGAGVLPHPVKTCAVNVMGLVHLLDAVRRTDSVRVIVNITSDKCYENREWLWAYRQDEPMGGYDPYSSSKGCAELVTAAWRWSFFAGESVVALASARAGNVIGGDWAEDRILPRPRARVLRRQAVGPAQPRCSSPLAARVLDPLCGPLLLAERLVAGGGAYAEGWNFGPSDANMRPVGLSWRSSPAIGMRQPGAWQTGSSRTRPSM
jgi:CDP-glucose 4,6-dehydratase